MTEVYPFFRDEGERTLAVIGEEAIAADLNGSYQKPYAVLTKKQLYCKNERGNFIVSVDKLSRAGLSSPYNATSGFLWGAFITLLVVLLFRVWFDIRDFQYFQSNHYLYPDISYDFRWIVCDIIGAGILVAFILSKWIAPKISPYLLCVFPIINLAINLKSLTEGWALAFYMFVPLIGSIASVVLVIIHCLKTRGTVLFEVCHTQGGFSFSPTMYPAVEFKTFEEQVKRFCSGSVNGG